MMKFNALQFVNSLSCDLTGEFDDLEELIQANKAGEDNADKIHSSYTHLNSLIQGFEYMVEFIANDEDRKELTEIIAQKREEHSGFYPRCASIIYTKRLGKAVDITWCHHTADPDEFTVRVQGHFTRTFHTTAEVKEYINALVEGEA